MGTDGVDREYAGYYSGLLSNPIPAVGHSASATIQLRLYTLNSPGLVAGWVGVDDGEGIPNHLQAGIIGFSTDVEWYVEVDANGTGGDIFPATGVTSVGANIAFSIDHVGTRQWSATVNGTTYGPWTFATGHEANDTQFDEEDQVYNPSQACQSSFFYFQNTQPYNTTTSPHMTAFASPYYSVLDLSNRYFDTLSSGF